MSSEVLSPRIAPEGGRWVPIIRASYRPMTILGVFGLFGLMCAVLAIIGGDVRFQVSMGALGVMIVLFGAALVVFQEAAGDRRVRIAAAGHSLKFVPPTRVPVLFALVAVAGILPSVAALLLGAPTQSLGNGLLIYVVGALALGWLGQQALSLRDPAGLILNADGIRGVRGSKRVNIAWDDLVGAEVIASRSGAKLVLKRQSGEAVVIEPRWTGSDANLVAPIVNHFLRRPSDRATLVDPHAALRLVEAAAAH